MRTARETVADKPAELDNPAQRAKAWDGLGMSRPRPAPPSDARLLVAAAELR